MLKDLWVIIVGLIGGVAVGIRISHCWSHGAESRGNGQQFYHPFEWNDPFRGIVVSARGRKDPDLEHIAMVYARSRCIWSHPLSNHQCHPSQARFDLNGHIDHYRSTGDGSDH